MFISHPSATLNRLFRNKPYQGASPDKAEFLFIGLDANYSADIEESPIFPQLVDYHDDGVSFWRKHGVHHPFLLPQYRGDGRLYHRSFARIGFTPAQAGRVSFSELLHVPTCGRNALSRSDLDPSHLRNLAVAIREGAPKHVFVPPAVARLLRETGTFDWMFDSRPSQAGALKVLWRENDKTAYSHYHFSAYGKFQRQKDLEAAAIRSLVA